VQEQLVIDKILDVVDVRALQLRQIAVLQDQLSERVLRSEVLQNLLVDRVLNLDLLAFPQRLLRALRQLGQRDAGLRKRFNQLLVRADVELVADRSEDLGLETLDFFIELRRQRPSGTRRRP
jgi:hypothetical protein